MLFYYIVLVTRGNQVGCTNIRDCLPTPIHTHWISYITLITLCNHGLLKDTDMTIATNGEINREADMIFAIVGEVFTMLLRFSL